MNDATDADVRPTALRARHLVTLAARCKSARGARRVGARHLRHRRPRARAPRPRHPRRRRIRGRVGSSRGDRAGVARALVDRDDLPRQIARVGAPRGVGHTPRACPAPRSGGSRAPSWRTLPASSRPHPRLTPSPLVTPFVAWFLSGGMPSEWRGAWRRLFDSDVDGLSFQTFLSRVVDQGPALVAVRTRAGDVLGGVSSESLTSKPEFFGDARSFVFALGRAEPDRSVDRDPPAEVGAHPGFGRETKTLRGAPPVRLGAFPNGIGFGGQVGGTSQCLDRL